LDAHKQCFSYVTTVTTTTIIVISALACQAKAIYVVAQVVLRQACITTALHVQSVSPAAHVPHASAGQKAALPTLGAANTLC
jgi:hypothetical protein